MRSKEPHKHILTIANS